MRSLRLKLAVLIGSAALLAVAAAGGLVVALRITDATVDRALDAQRRLDLLSELSNRLTDYALAALAKTPTARPERLASARSRVLATLGAIETALVETEHSLGRAEVAVRSRRLARLRDGFQDLDGVIGRGQDQPEPSEVAQGAFNTFGIAAGPVLSFLVEAERQGVRRAREDQNQLSRALRWAASVLAATALVVAFLMHRAISRPILTQLEDIRRAAGAIGRGELETPLPVRAHDELGLLMATFNRMAARLRRREARVVTDRTALARTVATRTADLRAANERLHQVDRARRRFFADVSHELRTPLTVILGECEVGLRTRSLGEEQARSVLEVILKRGQLLQRRVEDLLRVARSESGMIELDSHTVDLRTVLSNAVDGLERQARRRKVALDWTPPPDPVEVEGDPDWLRQVVEGLIDNALRHAGTLTRVSVGLADRGLEAEISVEDDGRGFPAGSEDALFTRFAPRAREVPGYGIGLALARWVVEQHGGRIALEGATRSATGARIVIVLPKPSGGEGARENPGG